MATGSTGGHVVQFESRDGVIDLAWGHPDPALLPVEELREATAHALERYGADALAYGYPAGPRPFVEWLASHIGAIDGRAARPEEVLATAGSSQALDLLVTLLTRPGDPVLVPSPTYHLALRILADHPVRVVSIPTDEDGLRVDAVADAVHRHAGVDRVTVGRRGTASRPMTMYVVPTFGNPTGATVPVSRRRALVDLAEETNLVIIEDDAYRELWYEAPPPPSLWSLAAPGRVVRLGTFSKTLAPGLRTGYLTADAATVERLQRSGVLDSGGGVSHLGSLVVTDFARSGRYERNVDGLRRAYRLRRDALVETLRAAAPGSGEPEPSAFWHPSRGGYFVWLHLHRDIALDALASAADRHAVGFMPGTPFFASSAAVAAHRVRLAFTRYPPSDLVEAAHRFGAALAEARTGRVAQRPG